MQIYYEGPNQSITVSDSVLPKGTCKLVVGVSQLGPASGPYLLLCAFSALGSRVYLVLYGKGLILHVC